MVEANPPAQNMHPNRIAIGEDHLQFRNDAQIMGQLGDKGKLRCSVLKWGQQSALFFSISLPAQLLLGFTGS